MQGTTLATLRFSPMRNMASDGKNKQQAGFRRRQQDVNYVTKSVTISHTGCSGLICPEPDSTPQSVNTTMGL